MLYVPGGSVANSSTIRGGWRLIKLRWRAWRSRLRRDRAALALAMTLSLAVFEPLLCIVSCQFWMPFVFSNYFPAQHEHHHHMHTQAANMAAMPIPLGRADVALIGKATPAAVCIMHMGYPSESPLPPPPAPLHETLPTLVLPLFIFLLAAIYLSVPLTGPPRVFIPVPLRPPIPIAG
jgi:hypothetical protein